MFPELQSRDRKTGNPLVVDAACGAELSGLSRRSFSEDGSAASANYMDVPARHASKARRAGHRVTAGSRTRGLLEQYVAGFETRGHPEGRTYLRSQQVIHETSGLRGLNSRIPSEFQLKSFLIDARVYGCLEVFFCHFPKRSGHP